MARAEPTLPARFAATAAADGQAIAVGAVDADDQLAGFSNRAGSARDQFLVAPGVGILAPALGGGAATVSGTSFATPHVSGAAALVLQAAPFLSADEVVELLLESATDLGAPGTDAVYGRGLLNLSAALGPRGTLGVPLGDTVAAASAGLEARRCSSVRPSAPGPTSAARSSSTATAAPTGSTSTTGCGLRRPIRRSTAGSARRASASASSPRRSGRVSASPWPSTRMRTAGARRGPSEPAGEAFAVELPLGDPASAQTGRLTLSRGFGLQHRFGLMDLDPGLASGLMSQAALASPYLALADRAADGLVLAQAFARDTMFRVGILGSESARQEPFAPAQKAAVIGELVRGFGPGRAVTLQGGTVEEQQSLLDTRGGGALGLPERATTSFVGLTARWAVTARFALFGQGSLGLTSAGEAGEGLLDDVSQLPSSSFAAGASGRDLLTAGDRLTLAIAQPLRVEGGSATLRPAGRAQPRGADPAPQRAHRPRARGPRGRSRGRLPAGARRAARSLRQLADPARARPPARCRPRPRAGRAAAQPLLAGPAEVGTNAHHVGNPRLEVGHGMGVGAAKAAMLRRGSAVSAPGPPRTGAGQGSIGGSSA